VLTRLRARYSPIDEGLVPEHAERALGMLRNFAIGSALIHGHAAVNDYDLAQVAHIALSSGNAGQGRLLRVVLENHGRASSPKVEELLGVSRPTALKYMRGLENAGLVRLIEGDGTIPEKVKLRQPFTELLTAPLLKPKRGEGEYAGDNADHRA
jgi:hypothetical protein